jgi:type I restriction enzyme, S subunit
MLTLKEQTMLGNIPNDWRIKPLISLLSSHYPGEWGEERGANMIKVLRSTNLTNDGRLDLSDVTIRSLKPELADLLMPKKGDILLERSGGGPDQPVGRVGFVDSSMQGYAFSNFLHLLRPDSDRIHQHFLGWILWQINRTKRILRLEQQTTQMRNLNYRDYLSMPLPVPSYPEEQKAIAHVLDAVDTMIEQTHETIESVAALRRSLMQQLLPPWIGFRHLDTRQMPSEVETIEIAREVADICNGSTPSRAEGRYWRNGTIPWLPTGKVHDRVIVAADQYVTDAALRECSISILPLGTVLVGMIGQGKTRGMSAYLGIEACINQNFGAFIPRKKLFGKWLFYYFDYHYSRLREVGGGTNQGALNCYLLKRIRLPLPSVDRQKEVAAVLDVVEDLEQAHKTALQHRLNLKAALMHNLLTGKVRVNHAIDQILPLEAS